MPKFPLSGYHPHATRKKVKKTKPSDTGWGYFTGMLFLSSQEVKSYITHWSKPAALSSFTSSEAGEIKDNLSLAKVLFSDRSITLDMREDVLSGTMLHLEGELNGLLSRQRNLLPVPVQPQKPLQPFDLKQEFFENETTTSKTHPAFNRLLNPTDWVISWIDFWNSKKMTYTHADVLNRFLEDAEIGGMFYSHIDLIDWRGDKKTIPSISADLFGGPPFVYLTDIHWFPELNTSPLSSIPWGERETIGYPALQIFPSPLRSEDTFVSSVYPPEGEIEDWLTKNRHLSPKMP